mgnify:CR=1 FL=1
MKVMNARNVKYFLRFVLLSNFLAILSLNAVNATNYYIANNGDDKKNGETPDQAWKTIAKINSIELKPGDSILFKSNEIFSGELLIKYSGTSEAPIVISSYGQGGNPVLSGAIYASGWSAHGGNIYSASIEQYVYSVFKNNKRLPLARWPNRGYHKIDAGDKLSLTDNLFALVNFNLSGASARIKAVDWQSETMYINQHQNDQVFFGEKMIYSCKKDYGYFLDNKYEFLDTINEWYFDKEKGQLFLYSKSSPTNILASVLESGITIETDVEHVTITGLSLEKFNKAGIFGQAFSKHITIENCNFQNTLIYGAYIDKGTQNYKIINCKFYDIPGRGISTLESSNLLIEGNKLERIGLWPGYGFNGVNNAVAIAILKSETIYFISDQTIRFLSDANAGETVLTVAKKLKGLPFSGNRFMELELEKQMPNEKEWIKKIVARVGEELSSEQLESKNNIIRENYIDSIGYIGIRLDGSHSIAERNIVKNTILHMNDGGAIYCWAQHFDYTHNNVFRKNIVINPVGSAEATPNNRLFGIGIYVDNRCRNITIEDNIVLEAKAGILINDNSFGHTIINNTTYNNLYGMMFSEYYRPGTLKGCKTEHNIFFSKERHQRCVFVESRLSEHFNPSTFDHNFYGSPYYTYPILELTYKDQVRRYHEFTLESWQRKKGFDDSSRYIAPEDPEAKGNESFILINDTGKEKEFTLQGDRKLFDINGNQLNKKVNLKPFTSLIVIID